MPRTNQSSSQTNSHDFLLVRDEWEYWESLKASAEERLSNPELVRHANYEMGIVRECNKALDRLRAQVTRQRCSRATGLRGGFS